MSLKSKTELLCPAGSLKAMRYAFAYGADAIFAGQPRFSLRVRNNEFNHIENLAIAIEEAHNLGKKFYLVVNIAAHNAKLKGFIEELAPVVALKPDALIMSDPGMIMLVQEHYPDMELHLSVQANAVNWATVKFWGKLGIKRIILSRELSFKEIEEIRQAVPEMELEVFVHGALCMAYSGRCLLSGYINHRDANQGTCTNACRWRYDVEEADENLLGEIISKDNQEAEQILDCCESSALLEDDQAPTLGVGPTTKAPFILKDPQRPLEEMTAFEDEHGTYIMNSKDLRAIQYVEKLIDIGVNSLKIEGRTKSHYYVARTAQCYRKAIDDAEAGRPFDNHLMDMLDSLAHRGYTEGFLQRHKHKAYQNYETGSSRFGKQVFVGEIEARDQNIAGLTKIIVKNRFAVGDRLELMTPNGNVDFILKIMHDKHGAQLSVAPGDGHVVYVQLPERDNLSYALLMRYL